MPQPRRQPGARPTTPPPATSTRPGTTAVVVTAGATAALGSSERTLPIIGPALAAKFAVSLTETEIRALVRAATAGFRKGSTQRRAVVGVHYADTFRRQRPWATAAELRGYIAEEVRYEGAFRTKQMRRLQRDLPQALRDRDPQRRGERVESIIRRESRYSAMREQAVTERAAGTSDALNVRAIDLEGALWQLGARTHHTPDCVLLHGHVLPWEVLIAARLIPPVHNGCGCRLRPRREAWLMGITPTVHPVMAIDDAWDLVNRARALGHEPVGVPLLAAA